MTEILKKAFKISFISIVCLVGLFLAYLYVHKVYFGNFYTVEKDVLYRSGQPDAEQLKKYKEKYGIKTVISLKRARPDKAWYREEIKAAKELGLYHFDIALSSSMEAPIHRMDEIVRLYKHAPKPILVHCEGGSDRTGLAIAIYQYTIKHKSAKDAESEGLSILYGHFPYMGSGTDAMSQSFKKFVRHAKKMRY